jgi:DNA-binding cell septation regulator SpoVG
MPAVKQNYNVHPSSESTREKLQDRMDRYGDVDNFESNIKSEVKDENGVIISDFDNAEYRKKIQNRVQKRQKRENGNEDN